MSAFTRAQIAGNGAGQANMRSRDYQWSDIVGGAHLIIRKVKINFDALATATGVALALSDTYQIMDINAGETVVMMGFNVETAATAAADMDIGFTSGDTDGLVDGIEANDATPTVVAAPFGLLSGTYFATADTIDVLEKSGAQTLAACVCTFWALITRKV